MTSAALYATPLTILCFVILGLILGAVGVFIGISYRKKVAEREIGSAEEDAKRILNEALKEAQSKKKELQLEAQDKILQARLEADEEIKGRRNEITRQENRLVQKEENLEKRTGQIEAKEEKIQKQTKLIEQEKEKTIEIKEEALKTLERISELTREEARAQIMEKLNGELLHEKALSITAYKEQTKQDQEEIARDIISEAIQRFASDQVSETTVSVVSLPNDEMKGRIIGREGRNIRSLETITGVDLIIDDTPEVITISCFDPVRRAVARLTLEKLISDGRIHPSRIEEMYDKSRREIDQTIKAKGESAVLELGIHNLHPELIKVLGRLHFRTSFGQNVLKHSLEVAHISGMMAAEIGADVKLAVRGGLLHDIGKALDHEVEGTHVKIGVDLARKYRENKEVLHAIEAHHGDVEPRTPVAFIVAAADAISAARPGARRENVENYIKRLEQLEDIGSSFEGVERTFAIQAGREIRVMVNPDKISDDQMVILSRDIAKRIEDDMDYPGQIKVHIVRESRVVDFAK